MENNPPTDASVVMSIHDSLFKRLRAMWKLSRRIAGLKNLTGIPALWHSVKLVAIYLMMLHVARVHGLYRYMHWKLLWISRQNNMDLNIGPITPKCEERFIKRTERKKQEKLDELMKRLPNLKFNIKNQFEQKDE